MKKYLINKTGEYIYYEKALNGLPIFIWQNKNVHNTFAAINVNYGSCYYRYKKGNKIVTNKTGIAHFLEHVMFNVKKDVNASDLFRKMGTFDNAYTDTRNTCYHITYQDNEFDSIKLLIDMVLTPYITPELVEKERGIIVEEKRRSMNNPYRKLYYEHMNALYVNNNCRESTLGTIDDIKTITANELLSVYYDFYNPHNMQLVVCGNTDPEKLMNDILKILEQYPERKYQKKAIYYPNEPTNVNKKKCVVEGNVVNSKVKFSYKIPRSLFNDFDKRTIRYLTRIILNCNFGNTSLFREKLFLDGLVNNFNASFYLEDDYMVITFAIESDDYRPVIKKIQYKMQHLQVTEDDFIAKTHSFLATMITNFEYNESVSDILINNMIEYGKMDYDIVDKYLNVKYKDVNKIIKAMDLSNHCLVVLEPQKNSSK